MQRERENGGGGGGGERRGEERNSEEIIRINLVSEVLFSTQSTNCCN